MRAVAVTRCAEGAIEIVYRKARVVREELCNGAGFCIGVCPIGALTIEEREAAPFSAEAVGERRKTRGTGYEPQKCFRCGTGEDAVPVLPCHMEGRSIWVCVKCVPALIHG